MTFLIVSIFLILLFIGIFFLIMKVSTKLGLRKVGIGIISFLAIGIMFFPAYFIFEDFFFFQSDAKEKLEEHDILLTDNFKMNEKSISGVMDNTLRFQLSISESDKEKIIGEFSKSPYLITKDPNEMYDIRSEIPSELKNDTIIYATYEEDNYWNLEYYKVLKNGYVRTWDIIQISKNRNELSFIRHE